MCELLGLSAATPVSVSLSLARLAEHGAESGAYPDGWGIAYYEQRDVRLLKGAEPAGASDLFRFIEEHCFRSTRVIAHTRHAMRGPVAFENTQPFARELGGRAHVFAHNGLLDEAGLRGLPFGRSLPMGDTDSEVAFCVLLGRLEPLWRSGEVPPLDERSALVAAFAKEIRALGPANFLYADGDALFAHGDRRCHLGEAAPRPPGLHVLHRTCPPAPSDMRGGGVELRTQSARHVTLFASVPLTEEPWKSLPQGQLVVAKGGRIVARLSP